MPAHYSLPVFNNIVNIWRNGRLYTDPPDVITVGNLALGRRVSGSKLQSYATNPSDGGMWLLVPIATDVRDSKSLSGEDMVEVPGGTGRLYTVKWVDDIGKGFANEHRFAVIMGLAPWGVPFPGPPMPPPPPPGTLPYSNGFGAAFAGDNVSWVPSGNIVAVFVWVASPSGSVPNLVSSLQGPLTALTFQTGLTSFFGVRGGVYTYQYAPAGIGETLSVSSPGANATLFWAVFDTGKLTFDHTQGLLAFGTTSTSLSFVAGGVPSDWGGACVLGDPTSTTGVVSGAFVEFPLSSTSLMTDAFMQDWIPQLFIADPLMNPGANLILSWGAPSNIAIAGQTVAP